MVCPSSVMPSLAAASSCCHFACVASGEPAENAHPAVSAPMGQPHRVGVRRAEERRRRRGSPIDQEPSPGWIGQAQSADVHRLRVVAGTRSVARAGVALARGAGSTDVTVKIYPHMRHEILNETGHEQVFADVLTWVETCVAQAPAPQDTVTQEA